MARVAPSYVGIGSFYGSDATSYTYTIPAGVEVGDVLVAFHFQRTAPVPYFGDATFGPNEVYDATRKILYSYHVVTDVGALTSAVAICGIVSEGGGGVLAFRPSSPPDQVLDGPAVYATGPNHYASLPAVPIVEENSTVIAFCGIHDVLAPSASVTNWTRRGSWATSAGADSAGGVYTYNLLPAAGSTIPAVTNWAYHGRSSTSSTVVLVLRSSPAIDPVDMEAELVGRAWSPSELDVPVDFDSFLELPSTRPRYAVVDVADYDGSKLIRLEGGSPS